MTDVITMPLPGRPYDIHIGAGLLDRAGALIGTVAQRRRLFVLTDETVAAAHLQHLVAGCPDHQVRSLALPAGESTKCWAMLEKVVSWLLDEQAERDDVLVTLGGGVIGDLGGFAAAVFRRGIGVIQVPTTLLAQVDSSVGGKTGINTTHGKNLVGAFHQPRLVLADLDVLNTLPARDFLSGYGEVVKYGLLGDLTFFEWLEGAGPALAAGDLEARARAVRRSCKMKADIVLRDETERGDRALLNLGHTFAHALEAATGYSDRLLHGEAVAIGCGLAFELSQRLGLCPQEAPSRVRAHLKTMGMKADPGDIPGPLPDADGLIDLMRQDKKVRDGDITFVLARDIGAAFVAPGVDLSVVRGVLSDALAQRERA